MRKMIYAFAFAILVSLLVSRLALAGGWAVVTLDQLPPQGIAGEPLTIGLMVRQHGVTPTNTFNPVITAHSPQTGESFSIVPEQQGPEGHFVATVTLSSPGIWNWSIKTISLDQPMPPLTILALAPAKQPEALPRESGASPSFPLEMGLAGLVSAVGALLFWRRTRASLALGLLVVAVAVGLAGLASTAIQASPSAARTESSSSIRQASPVETGKALFLAKGCVVCHQNGAVSDWQGSFRSLEVGPNLSGLKLTSGFLHRWLKDPSAVKPGTEMPTLGLSDHEIDALTAFLTQP